MDKINGLPEGMVLIAETCGIKVHNNYGNMGQEHSGFTVVQPSLGFVKKEYWESLNIFQNLNMDGDDIINKMVLIGKEVSEEDILEHTDLQKWMDLRGKTKSFMSTVEEFIILVGVDRDGR